MPGEPYRSLADRGSKPPARFDFDSKKEMRVELLGGVFASLFAVFAFAPTILAHVIGVGGALASLSATYVTARKRAKPVSFTVSDGLLAIRGIDPPLEAVPLAEVLDVALSTRTIEPVQPTLTVGAFVASKVVLSPQEIARVEVVLSGNRAPIALQTTYGSYSEAIESMGKLRVFLRAHRWLPLDEREDG